MQDVIIISLLQKYINNKCTEQELKILLEWLKSADDHTYFDSIGKPLWEEINRTMDYPSDKRVEELQAEVASLLKGVKQQHVLLQVKKRRLLNPIWYQVAAIAILIISITFGIVSIRESRPAQAIYTEIIVEKGERKTYLLADGSRITLNSGSKLFVPKDFNRQERVIRMTGEGFFQITHNPEKPFIIRNNDTQVKVLGTSFNVKAYEEDDFIGITVSTGKVQVKMDSQDLQMSLTPNEHLLVNKKNGNVRKETLAENNYTKWMQGSLYFHKEPLREVIHTINRTYNREVILECKQCDRIISGSHDNQSLEAVVEAICFTTGLKSRKEGNHIIIFE